MTTEQNKKNSILWLSPYAPYDDVAHAGGQDFNHFLKYLNSKQFFNLHVAALCLKSDENKLDLDLYHIPNTIYTINKSKLIYHLGLKLDNISKYNPFHYCGSLLTPYTKFCFSRLLKKYFSHHPSPDIIILHWTQAALLYPTLSKMYPSSKLVIIEVDVAYLGYKRQVSNSNTFFHQKLWKMKYSRLKAAELQCVNRSALTVVLNEKDAQILELDGIERDKIFVSIPFFHSYIKCERRTVTSDILYFGYMGREENHLSALWFINNVMPLLDNNIHFTIVGTEPRRELLRLQSSRIQVLGFVEDIAPHFQTCLCMVAPLVLGAGIKIKILEALSSGIPVLTNSVGIEGIPAKDREDFFYCETPEQYAEIIRKLNTNMIYANISSNAKKFISTNFNTDSRLDELIDKLTAL